ncbi:MAG: hypothetical protein ACUVTN_08700 [Thermodesulfobacteriota bacterium]
MLEITDAAVNQFQKILSEVDATNSNIRIFISGGGCCSSYGLDITEKGEDGGSDLYLRKGEGFETNLPQLWQQEDGSGF